MSWPNDAIVIPPGTPLVYKDFIAVRYPGGTAQVGRLTDFFVERVPDAVLQELSKVWYLDIQAFDSLAEARAWVDAKGCEVYDLPSRPA